MLKCVTDHKVIHIFTKQTAEFFLVEIRCVYDVENSAHKLQVADTCDRSNLLKTNTRSNWFTTFTFQFIGCYFARIAFFLICIQHWISFVTIDMCLIRKFILAWVYNTHSFSAAMLLFISFLIWVVCCICRSLSSNSGECLACDCVYSVRQYGFI